MKNNVQKQTLNLFGPLVIAAAIAAGIGMPATATDTNNKPAFSEALKRYDQAVAEIDKGSNWKDPEKVLPEVTFDGLPITEVVEMLRKQFNNDFDVLFPFGQQEDLDWASTAVTLRLKSVTASEIFNAMNLVFASARTRLHWELMMNGHRSTALLRVLPEQKPSVDPTTGLPVSSPTTPTEKPMVFFVGDLIGDESGKMTPAQLLQTIEEVCKMSIGHFSYHSRADLLIVRGSGDDIMFVQNTLAALRDKVRLDAERTREQNRKTLLMDELKQRAQPEAERKTPANTAETKSNSDATKPH
jgi:hypothetical protein